MIRKHSISIIGLILVVLPGYAAAQSGAEYTRWKNWCISIGGTVSGTVSNPVCIPPARQTTTQPTPAGPTPEELDRQAREREAERIRKEKERKQQEDAVKAAEEAAKQADFIQKRDEATIELKGIDSTKLALKEISDAPKPCGPSLNAMVVDLCDPGTDLPKGVSDAIEGVFKDSPRDVTDRVRKGFNGVMNREWNLAKLWFKDALARDPTNKKLQSLLELASFNRARLNLQIPEDKDLALLFRPDDYIKTPLGTKRPREFMIDSRGNTVEVPDDYRGATQTYVRLKDRSDLVQTPTADDLNLLFGDAFVPAPRAKVPIFRLDDAGALVELPRDYRGNVAVFIKGRNGEPVQIPLDSDGELLFPPAPKATSRRKTPK